MKSETGTCIYCGQVNAFEIEDGMALSEEERDKIATKECSCENAKNAREQEAAYEKAEWEIDKIFREDDEKVKDIMRKGMRAIQNDEIKSMTIDTGLNVKCKVSMSVTGCIKVERKEIKKKAAEI